MSSYSISSVTSLDQELDLPAISGLSDSNQSVTVNTMRAVLISQEILVDMCSNVNLQADGVSSVRSGSSLTSDVSNDYYQICSKLYHLFVIVVNHPDDIHAAQELFQYLADLNAKGMFEKYPELVKLLKECQGSDGQPVYVELVDILVQYHFYKTGDASTAYLDQIVNAFSGDNEIASAIRKHVEDIKAGKAWKDAKGNLISWETWVANNKEAQAKPGSLEMWNWIAGGVWGNFLQGEGSQVSKYLKDMRMSMIDSVMNQFKDNAFLLVTILMYMLSDFSSCEEISGFGSMGKFFSDRTEDMSQIISFWTTQKTEGGTEGKDYKDGSGYQFMDMLENLKFKIDNSPFAADIKQAFDKQIADIENIDAGFTVRIDGKDHSCSLLDLYNIATGKITLDPPGPLDKAIVAQKLNSEYQQIIYWAKHPPVLPDPTAPDYPAKKEQYDKDEAKYVKYSKEYETIDYGLKSLSSPLTDQSQVQTTLLTKVTNDSQVNLNMMNKSLNGETGIVGLLNRLIQNQVSR